MERTDIVIPLGTGSRWKDNELRYALRSVEKYAAGFGTVYIVGHCPSWLNKTTVRHLPSEEDKISPRWKEWNIKNKIEQVCRLDEVSDQFFYMNDDHFLLQPVDINRYPHYHSGFSLKNIKHYSMRYQRTVDNTVELLALLKKPSMHYDIHVPMRIRKRSFIEAMASANWDYKYGYLIKSLYMNQCQWPGSESMVDCKINKKLILPEIRMRVNGRNVFSIGELALDGDMEAFLKEQYPEKSKYEL